MLKSNKKIAIIGVKGIPSRYSGLEVHASIVAEGLAQNGYEVSFFCRERYCEEIVNDYKGMKIYHIPSINTKHLDAISYAVIATLYAAFKGYNIFWFHALGPAIMMFIPAMLNKKIVSTVHGLDWKREKFGKLSKRILLLGEKSIAKFANRIIVLNKSDKRYFMEKYGRDCELIRNGTEIVKRLDPDIIKNKYGLNGKDYFLYMSRIVPEKKLDVLIDAFKKTKTQFRLVIAGQGAHTDGYVNMVRNMSKDDKRIMFLGFVNGNERIELYSNAYAYCLPSSIEGQSIGLLEAMSYGLPCIVSDISENIETAEDDAFFFHEGDKEDLFHTIEHVIENKAEAIALGRIAKEQVEKEYLWDDKIKDTVDVFDSLF